MTVMTQEKLLQYLESYGYQVSLDAKGRYLQGILQLVGGLENVEFLREPYFIKLFNNAQLRKGKAFTIKQLQQIANPSQQIEQFYAIMQTLIAKELFFRGYMLQCPACDLETWYSLENTQEFVTCQGCRTAFQMPLKIDFAFRPNLLFLQGLVNGALTVLLTVHYFKNQCEDFLWESNLILKKDGQHIEVDLIASCDGKVIIAECKDNFKITSEHLTLLQNQLQNMQTFLSTIPDTCFHFSTLYAKEFPESLRTFLDVNQIQILTRKHLLLF